MSMDMALFLLGSLAIPITATIILALIIWQYAHDKNGAIVFVILAFLGWVIGFWYGLDKGQLFILGSLAITGPVGFLFGGTIGILFVLVKKTTKLHIKYFLQFMAASIGGILVGYISRWLVSFNNDNLVLDFKELITAQPLGMFIVLIGITSGSTLGMILTTKNILKINIRYRTIIIAIIASVFISIPILPLGLIATSIIESAIITFAINWQERDSIKN